MIPIKDLLLIIPWNFYVLRWIEFHKTLLVIKFVSDTLPIFLHVNIVLQIHLVKKK